MAINLTLNRIVLVKEKSARYDLPRSISSPRDVRNAVQTVMHLEAEAQEVFGAIFVNMKNNIIGIHELSRGSLNASIVSPRDVFKTALLHNAAGMILFHNHPSGNPMPSPEDKAVTTRLKSAGKLLEIEVMDHVIIGDNSYFSFKEENLL